MVGLAWWGVAGASFAGCVAGGWVYEGSGHEIFLDGEEDEQADAEALDMEMMGDIETPESTPRPSEDRR